MKRSGITLAVFLMVSATAQAADLGWNGGGASTIYSPTPISGWSGFYAGVNADYGFGGVTRRATIGGVLRPRTTSRAECITPVLQLFAPVYVAVRSAG